MSEAFFAATCCCLIDGGGGDDDDDDKETDPPICQKPGSQQPPGATCEPISYLLVAGKISYSLGGGVSFKTTGATECLECFGINQAALGCLEALPEVRTTYDNEMSYDYAQTFNGTFKVLMAVDSRGNAYTSFGPNGQYPPRVQFNFGSSVENNLKKEEVSRVCPRYQGQPVPPPYVAGSVYLSTYVDNYYVSEAPYARVYQSDGSEPYINLKREVVFRSCDSSIGDQIYGCEELDEGCYVRWTFGAQFKHPKSTFTYVVTEAYENPYGALPGGENITVTSNCEKICDTFYPDNPSQSGEYRCPIETFIFRTYARIGEQESTCPKADWEKPIRTVWGTKKNSTNPVYSTEGATPCEFTQDTVCRGISGAYYAAAGWPENEQFNYGNIVHFGDFTFSDADGPTVYEGIDCSPLQADDMEGEDQHWTSPNFFFLPVQHWSDDCEGVCRGNGQSHSSQHVEDFQFKCVPASSTGGGDECPCLIYGRTGDPQPANNDCGDCRGKPDEAWQSLSYDNVKINIGTHIPLEADQLPDPSAW